MKISTSEAAAATAVATAVVYIVWHGCKYAHRLAGKAIGSAREAWARSA